MSLFFRTMGSAESFVRPSGWLSAIPFLPSPWLFVNESHPFSLGSSFRPVIFMLPEKRELGRFFALHFFWQRDERFALVDFMLNRVSRLSHLTALSSLKLSESIQLPAAEPFNHPVRATKQSSHHPSH